MPENIDRNKDMPASPSPLPQAIQILISCRKLDFQSDSRNVNASLSTIQCLPRIPRRLKKMMHRSKMASGLC